jgi:hypothetical protein
MLVSEMPCSVRVHQAFGRDLNDVLVVHQHSFYHVLKAFMFEPNISNLNLLSYRKPALRDMEGFNALERGEDAPIQIYNYLCKIKLRKWVSPS